MQDKEFQEFRTTRVTGGGYKGIPNGLKQSRPCKLCAFTLYTIRCCLCQTRTSVGFSRCSEAAFQVVTKVYVLTSCLFS